MGWQNLIATGKQFRQLAEQDQTTPPVACWPCGTPLKRGPNNELFCPADGWTPDDTTGELRS